MPGQEAATTAHEPGRILYRGTKSVSSYVGQAMQGLRCVPHADRINASGLHGGRYMLRPMISSVATSSCNTVARSRSDCTVVAVC